MKTPRVLALLTAAFLLAASFAKAEPAEAPPQNVMLFNEKYAAVAVQTEADAKFVLVHVGALSRGMQDWVTHEREVTKWGFQGTVHLVDRERTRAAGHAVDEREIAVKYTSSEPDTLYLDGKAYALDNSGRIFILRDHGDPVQVARTLTLRNQGDLVKLGALADAELLKSPVNTETKPAIQSGPDARLHPATELFINNHKFGAENGCASDVPLSGQATCGHPGHVSDVSWKFLRTDSGGDVYEFARKYPSDAAAAKTVTKEVTYAGKALTLWEDDTQKILLRPKP